MKKKKQRDLFAAGERIHRLWRDGDSFYLKLLGDYGLISRPVIDRRLSNDALTEEQQREFWRGWDTVTDA